MENIQQKIELLFFNHIISVDGAALNNGNYTAYLYIEANATGAVHIPVNIQVGYQADIGDINYDGELYELKNDIINYFGNIGFHIIK